MTGMVTAAAAGVVTHNMDPSAAADEIRAALSATGMVREDTLVVKPQSVNSCNWTVFAYGDFLSAGVDGGSWYWNHALDIARAKLRGENSEETD